MKKLLGLLCLGWAAPLWAAAPDCDVTAQAALQQRVEAGEAAAWYVRGGQLLRGECGSSHPQQGFDLLARAVAANYPPALYAMGGLLRDAGRVEEAASHYFGAAQRGYRLAEVELAYLHADEESSLRNDALAYAWFALAIHHEEKAELKRLLESNLAKLYARMGKDERADGKRLKAGLFANLEKIPAWQE